jgi:hypothetical protein
LTNNNTSLTVLGDGKTATKTRKECQRPNQARESRKRKLQIPPESGTGGREAPGPRSSLGDATITEEGLGKLEISVRIRADDYDFRAVKMLELLWSNQLLQLLYTSLGIQWVGWALSAYFHTEKFYDLTGTVRHLYK